MGGVAESMTNAAPRRVAVLTPHALLGEALTLLLERDGRFAVAIPSEARQPATLDVADQTDIILLDSALPRDIAVEVCRIHRERSPGVAVVLLDGEDANGSNELAAATGAVTVVSTRTRGDVLTSILLGVSEGTPISRACAPAVRDPGPLGQLTDRERQVLTALAAGDSPDVIASALGISPHTVRTHIENAMARLGVASRLEAVAVLRHGQNGNGSPRTSTKPEPLRRFGRHAHEHRPGQGSTRLVVGADATIFREALCAALADIDGVEVVGEASSVSELDALLIGRRWDVAVVDESVRGGVVAACELVKSADDAPRVLVTSRAPDQTVLLAAVEAGADGYLTRGAGLDQLAEAVRRVRNGEASIPPRMLGALLRNLIDRRREEDSVVERISNLTKRERTVLGLLVEGLDQEQIAARLVVSPHTARTHVQNVLRKLRVHSRLEAVSLVTTHNLHERFELNAKAV